MFEPPTRLSGREMPCLPLTGAAVYSDGMTANEVIQEIMAMTTQEREQVAAFLRQLESGQAIRHADDKTVDEAADRVLNRHAELMRKLAL